MLHQYCLEMPSARTRTKGRRNLLIIALFAVIDIPTKFMVLLAHHLSYHVFSTLSDTKLN